MDNDESEKLSMERFEDLGRKLFQVPKESVEQPEEPCEQEATPEDEEPASD